MSENSNTAINTYIQTVNEYANYLLSNPSAIETLVDLFNQKGQEYFGHHRSGYIAADPEYIVPSFRKEIYDRAGFFQKKRINEGYTENASEDEIIFMNEAAFDDSFRHTIFLNVSDMEHPKLVDGPAGLLRDAVLRWDKVEELPRLFPDGKTIAVHLDMMEQIFFPIPTQPASGGRRTQRRRGSTKRKARKTRKTRHTN